MAARRIDRVLGTVGKILISLGVLTLLFAAFQLWGTGWEERQGQEELAASLAAEDEGAGEEPDADLARIAERLAKVDPTTAPPMPAPPQGEGLGIIRIPKIELDRAIVEGTSKDDLKKGPGHYVNTPLPGQKGNAGIAGHRTTYGAPFNRIDELVPGDLIEVFTGQGKFVYEVVPPELDEPHAEAGAGWKAVTPAQSEVLRDFEDNRLTLTACHPKYSARLRIIVVAKLIADPAQAVPVPVPAPAEPEEDDTGQEVAAGEEFEADLGWQPDNIRPTLMYGGGALGVWFLAFLVARRRTRRWPVYLVFTPVFLVPLWFCYVYLDRTLPSL